MRTLQYIFLVSFSLFFTSCDLDLSNPNAASENEVLSTKEGLLALATGISQTYSTSALGSVILTPSVTTRETAIMTTFANLEELEQGGSQLSSENGYTSRLFTRLMKSKGMAEDLLNALEDVEMSDGTKAGLLAWGNLFRALCLGDLAHHYENVAIENERNNNAQYAPRNEAYEMAISILENSVSTLQQNTLSTEFTSSIGNAIDLMNTSRLLLARYHLILGQYQDALNWAEEVDLASSSTFFFDDQNFNPVYTQMFEGTVSYAPRADFGLPSNFTIDEGDQRVDFWVDLSTTRNSLNNLPVATMVSPFFNGVTAGIPVYRLGEVLLIQAECHARLGNLEEAENFLNQVRKKQSSEDPFGIGAGLQNDFSANGNMASLLDEIYKNRRLELFLTGLSLEDSRRFSRPNPSGGVDFTEERNRNYYPYPENEHQNNANTPDNPGI